MLSRAGPTWTEAEVDAAKVAGVGARAEFDETLVALRTGLTDLDPLEVLARAALSLTFRIATMQFEPDKKGVEVFHIEILQALALSGERRIDADSDFPATTQASIDLIDRNGQAYRGLWLRKLGIDPALNQREELIALLQSWTMAIRGPRHVHQTQEFLRAICAGVDGAFRQVPIPMKPPLVSEMIAPPCSEMMSPPGDGAVLAMVVVVSFAFAVKPRD